MYNLTRGLHECGAAVHLLAINTLKHFVDIAALPDHQKPVVPADAVTVDTYVNTLDAIRNLFSTESYNIIRFYSKQVEDTLAELLTRKPFDIVHLESLFVTPYLDTIRKHSRAKIVLRAHNVEFRIWEQMTRKAPPSLKKAYLKVLTERLRNHEISSLNKFDAVVPITDRDAEDFKSLGCRSPLFVSPFSLNLSEYIPASAPAEKYSLFHLGSMDWMPNDEAIRWFMRDIWKVVKAECKEARFFIAGRGMPEWIKKIKDPAVTVIENVEDAKEFISKKSVMAVPLKTGSGMRVKIVEGMALSKAVVSTSVGAEGIRCTHEKNILIADDAVSFGKALAKCLLDQALAETLGRNARKLAEEQYDNKKNAEELIRFYSTLV